MLRILVRQSTWTSTTGASAFFSCFSRSGTSLATTSMTFIFSASSADRLTASRTARSAHSAFLPRILARPRIYAAASLICLRIKVSFFSSFSDPPPPRATGEAAPRLVPGAMAAMWLAYRMKVPALAARAPPGATKLATWTGEARMSLMISRIEVSSPPGVSMRSTTSCALSFAARCSARRTKSALAGPIAPSRGTTITGGGAACADAKPKAARKTQNFISVKQEQIPGDAIVIRGARQNNLKNLTLAIPGGELVVVTGVSGSGKSSLVFDTLYAEGQRRYVETFSPYARQFLDRMDKPQVDAIEGIPPAIAIDQTNPVRTSRSTVGTMTELNDHLKLLFARAGRLFCRGCGQPVHRDSPSSVYEQLSARAGAAGDPRLVVTFPVAVPKNFKEEEVQALLKAQGYDRIHARGANVLEVGRDRLRLSSAEKTRAIEGIEAALKIGQGKINVYPLAADGKALAPWRFSSDLHCPGCDIHYSEPGPSLFSFNSPLGACETCRGVGRVIGIDYRLIVPDETKTLREGAIRPWQSPSFHECQDDIEKYAKKRGVPLDVPFRDLSAKQREWALEGEPEWVSWRKSWPGTWYGVARFFRWLETKAYKMHVRVLLSRYRAYTPCSACNGARLKPDALLWRVGTKEDADRVIDPARRFRPAGANFSDETLRALPGLTVHDLVLLPAERTRAFFEQLHLPAPLDEATDLLLTEIRARLRYVQEVGLGYLTLDRQSRTLSGGEVQRINLTTALGTSLVNTLFVLDEPSIGLHPRDMGRVIGVMQRLRDAGNSLVVVEHDPQIMLQADRLMDMGPGPGERGGEIVFFGTPDELKQSKTLTAEYLSGRKRASKPGTDHGFPENRGLSPVLELLGAADHNLKSIDVGIPLERLVCITGVSGSGKSTLGQDVVYPALRKAKGKPTETPGTFRELRGHALVGDVVMVDQTPIGRTTRSNPASYVGAWDAIRNIYAKEPLAKERRYTAGTFSFNSGNGRCPTCGGNGFEHVGMQFL